MNKDVVLVITRCDDPHADHIVPRIRDKNLVFRFNAENFPTQINCSISLGNGISGRISDAEQAVELTRIKSVWYRRPIEAVPDGAIKDGAARKFVIQESRAFTDGLWFQIDALWVNHPHFLSRASRKNEQLRAAKMIGWEIPETLITNDPMEARLFVRQYERVVVKTVQTQFVVSGDEVLSLFTHLIEQNDYKALDDVKFVPCIFQQLIPKRLELRITVIGDKVFVAALDSQKFEKTRIDWRRDVELAVPCEPINPPPEIISRSIMLVKHFGLQFSTMDVILTPDNRYVFLDLNPNGQWLWVELQTGMPMTEAFVALLNNPPKP